MEYDEACQTDSESSTASTPDRANSQFWDASPWPQSTFIDTVENTVGIDYLDTEEGLSDQDGVRYRGEETGRCDTKDADISEGIKNPSPPSARPSTPPAPKPDPELEDTSIITGSGDVRKGGNVRAYEEAGYIFVSWLCCGGGMKECRQKTEAKYPQCKGTSCKHTICNFCVQQWYNAEEGHLVNLGL